MLFNQFLGQIFWWDQGLRITPFSLSCQWLVTCESKARFLIRSDCEHDLNQKNGTSALQRLQTNIQLWHCYGRRRQKKLNQPGKDASSSRNSSFKITISDTSIRLQIRTEEKREMERKVIPELHIFMALPLTYLKSMESIIEPIRFLNTNPK